MFKIRLLNSGEEYREAESFQRTVWGFEDREIVPSNELVVAQKNGGFVFAAFDEEGAMAAFCFGIPGFRGRGVYHYSRMLGVLPKYQDRGLGYRMKMHQRNLVLKQRLGLIRWTVDPLQSRNAFFNFQKLGIVIREYVRDLYGVSSSKFNAGLETDRFIPEWHVSSRRVRRGLRSGFPEIPILDVLEGRTAAPALSGRPVESGVLEPHEARPNARDKRVFVEIPDNIDQLKHLNLDLARAWRFETRKVFLRLLERGYVVTGFSSGLVDRGRRSAYLLDKGFKIR